VPTYAKQKFWFDSRPRLNDNTGLMGMGNTSYGTQLCESLRGVRYVNFSDKGAFAGPSGCIGYADAAANQLMIVMQRAGDINLQILKSSRQ
jgi:hypothetical protein